MSQFKTLLHKYHKGIKWSLTAAPTEKPSLCKYRKGIKEGGAAIAGSGGLLLEVVLGFFMEE